MVFPFKFAHGALVPVGGAAKATVGLEKKLDRPSGTLGCLIDELARLFGDLVRPGWWALGRVGLLRPPAGLLPHTVLTRSREGRCGPIYLISCWPRCIVFRGGVPWLPSHSPAYRDPLLPKGTRVNIHFKISGQGYSKLGQKKHPIRWVFASK